MKVGVIGGGQLAKMLALAGYPIGVKIICLEPNLNCPASLVTHVIHGEYTDQIQLAKLESQVDVITYEFENIALSALQSIADKTPVYPPLSALQVSQDRWLEKLFFTDIGVPTTQYARVESWNDLQKAMVEINFPAIIKTRRFGYDGKGQYVVRNNADLERAWQELQEQMLIVENLVAFERELSLIAVRSTTGDIAFYPLTENKHANGILAISTAPFINDKLNNMAQNYVRKILTTLNYVGVLAVEFFQQGEQLIANEMAPRVHNSGHWTIEGAYISQFENHLRAILNLPLGSTAVVGKAAMFNLIGDMPELKKILSIPEAHCHLYGKSPRPRRKLGHITLCTGDEKLFNEKFDLLSTLICP